MRLTIPRSSVVTTPPADRDPDEALRPHRRGADRSRCTRSARLTSSFVACMRRDLLGWPQVHTQTVAVLPYPAEPFAER